MLFVSVALSLATLLDSGQLAPGQDEAVPSIAKQPSPGENAETSRSTMAPAFDTLVSLCRDRQ